MSFTAGQEVILRTPPVRQSGTPTDERVTVARVARKYAYVVRYGREVAFDLETGRERVGANDVGAGAYAGRLFTEESLAEHDRHEAAKARIFELVTRRSWWTKGLTPDELNQIADIVEKGMAR